MLIPHFQDRSWSFVTLLLVTWLGLLAPMGNKSNVLAQATGTAVTASQSTTATEYNLKLARIYATAKFITWPDENEGKSTPFVIGVVGPDPFQGGLQKLTTRKLKDRAIHVINIQSEKDYQFCHLLFVASDAQSALVDEILKRVQNEPVLVWRDQIDSRNTSKASCTFVREGGSILIETDPAELKRRQLVPDGQLMSLNLVRVVKPNKP